jgi:hypothetical protein
MVSNDTRLQLFNYIEITLNSVLQQAPSSELMQIEVIDAAVSMVTLKTS